MEMIRVWSIWMMRPLHWVSRKDDFTTSRAFWKVSIPPLIYPGNTISRNFRNRFNWEDGKEQYKIQVSYFPLYKHNQTSLWKCFYWIRTFIFKRHVSKQATLYLTMFRNQTDFAQSKDIQDLKDEIEDLSKQDEYLDSLLRSTTSAMNLAREDPTDMPVGLFSP